MDIGERLRLLREQKKLSQGVIEERTGLLRCYISRVENGHTVPAVETLGKFARALEMPLYQLLYDGNKPPRESIPVGDGDSEEQWGRSGKDARFLRKLQAFLARMDEQDREVLLAFAEKVTQRQKASAAKN
jgi:transcriptional regulator with XRE-family HTH domain